MLSIIYGEALKLKRSKMLWLIVLGALLPVVLNYFVARHQIGDTKSVVWQQLFQENLMLLVALMGPALFALFTGYIFAREYTERTINSFLTVPRSRVLLLLGKYVIMLPVIVATIALSFGLTLVSGFILRHELLTADALQDAGLRYLILIATQYALISVAATVSLFGKSYIPAMGLGVFAVISELTIMQSKYIMYYPWSAPLNLVMENFSPTFNNTALGVTVLAIAFFLPLLFNIAYYRRADVHSG